MDDFNEICLPPAASDLLESMRALGYSFEAAVADLLDNSVSAQSSSIDIKFSPHDDPYVAILDNGRGMLPADLTAAMRHGSKNPNLARNEQDLGRFGLGLKTASLSMQAIDCCLSVRRISQWSMLGFGSYRRSARLDVASAIGRDIGGSALHRSTTESWTWNSGALAEF